MSDNTETHTFSPYRDASLAVKYVHRNVENNHLNLDNSFIKGPITKILPMLSLFLRNKVLAWSAIVIYMYFFLQKQEQIANTDSSTSVSKNTESIDSGIIDLLSCTIGLLASYIDLVLPQSGNFPFQREINK